MNPMRQQTLYDQLDALGVAVDAGEVEIAAQCMTDYDAALHRYIQTTAPDTPLGVLQELLAIQNGLLQRMRERKAQIGATMLQAHRQDSASRAYAAVEVAP